MSESNTEPLRILAIVQKLGHPFKAQKPITEIIMNYAVNRILTDVHTLCQFMDAYPPFLLNQLINLCNCVGGDCPVALARTWIFFATFTVKTIINSN
ncbi:hypothetical protein TNCV_306991 [Trichonephila clavipes]|nr:hypothetical protein TNCV_306991 [Trichonephila clavipes]